MVGIHQFTFPAIAIDKFHVNRVGTIGGQMVKHFGVYRVMERKGMVEK